MYEDTCQKKKMKQISYTRNGDGRPTKEGTKEETCPRASRSSPWPCDLRGIRAIFAHEYVIFYRRGNYLIEGNPLL